MSVAVPQVSGYDEEALGRDLKKMKAIPLALLLIAAAVFVLARVVGSGDGIWGFVEAAAEAGMVGGLADWFAVTALFRRPLGLPIPHTALIPNKKDQLGDSLSTFVQANFLQPDLIADKVLAAQPAARVAECFADASRRGKVLSEGAELAAHGLESLSDEDVSAIISGLLQQQLASFEWGPPLGRVLSAVVEDGSHAHAVDLLFAQAHDWLVLNRDAVVEMVAERGPMQDQPVARFVHEQVGRKVHRDLLKWAAAVRDDRTHKVRTALDGFLRDFSSRMMTDPETIARVEAMKAAVLEHPEIERAFTAMWPATRSVLTEALRNPNSMLRVRVDEQVFMLTERLRTDAAFRTRIDTWAANTVTYLADRYGAEAVSLISDTVKRWDGQEASRRIELQVGRDLQLIRINGTVVGALAGIAIHAVGVLLG